MQPPPEDQKMETQNTEAKISLSVQVSESLSWNDQTNRRALCGLVRNMGHGEAKCHELQAVT